MSQQLEIGKGTRLYKGVLISAFIIVAMIGVAIWKDDPQFVSHIRAEITMKKISVNNHQLYVWVAKTPEQQKVSLTNLVTMPQEEGVVFVFPEVGNYPVWTTNMHFAVDIIWINDDGEVVDVAENVAPGLGYPANPKAPARYVLMLNAGMIAQEGIIERTDIDLTKIL